MQCEDPKVTRIMEMMKEIDEETSLHIGAEFLLLLSTSTAESSSPKEGESRKCQVCQTIKTPLWRRNEYYHTLCNACGIRMRTKGYYINR